MARKPVIHFKQSLWDRLTKPGNQGSLVPSSPSVEAERIKDSIRRDLEWLLNSRRSPVKVPEGMVALQQSLFTYGLEDITSLSPNNTIELEEFEKVLEGVIRHFEPRLTQVKVAFNKPDKEKLRGSLQYRIDAMLRLDPVTEPIVFDTILDLGNRAFRVKREGT